MGQTTTLHRCPCCTEYVVQLSQGLCSDCEYDVSHAYDAEIRAERVSRLKPWLWRLTPVVIGLVAATVVWVGLMRVWPVFTLATHPVAAQTQPGAPAVVLPKGQCLVCLGLPDPNHTACTACRATMRARYPEPRKVTSSEAGRYLP